MRPRTTSRTCDAGSRTHRSSTSASTAATDPVRAAGRHRLSAIGSPVPAPPRQAPGVRAGQPRLEHECPRPPRRRHPASAHSRGHGPRRGSSCSARAPDLPLQLRQPCRLPVTLSSAGLPPPARTAKTWCRPGRRTAHPTPAGRSGPPNRTSAAGRSAEPEPAIGARPADLTSAWAPCAAFAKDTGDKCTVRERAPTVHPGERLRASPRTVEAPSTGPLPRARRALPHRGRPLHRRARAGRT